jgi:hypothetical protein
VVAVGRFTGPATARSADAVRSALVSALEKGIDFSPDSSSCMACVVRNRSFLLKTGTVSTID